MTARVKCYYCKRSDREMRPYGPGGSQLCFPCMMDPKHPEREEDAKAAFRVQMDASEIVGRGVTVLGDGPIRPATDAERRLAGRDD